MSNRRAGAILAGIVLLMGIVIGFWPLSVDRGFVHVYDGDTVACGSAFGGLADNPDLDEFGANSDRATGYRTGCEDKLSSQRTIALVLIGLAGVGLAWLALTSRAAPPSPPMASDSPTPSAGDDQDNEHHR